jgi:hypothetical protein
VPTILTDFLWDMIYPNVFYMLLAWFLFWLMGRKSKAPRLMDSYYLTETLPEMRARWESERRLHGWVRRAL